MDIIVSSPGSPGTSLTENVKNKIIIIYDELMKHDDFKSLKHMKDHLKTCGINDNYARNILPFLQNCGFISYENNDKFCNDNVFTNTGRALVDCFKTIAIVESEAECEERKNILLYLKKIEEIIYFQGLATMMKNPKCNYAIDFFDVLRFCDYYGYIDGTEYLLLLYHREKASENADYLKGMKKIVEEYRKGEIEINVNTKTKNARQGEGNAKSVNSFPYVTGNFIKSGVMEKKDDKYYLVESNSDKVKTVIEEVLKCQR